MLAATVQSQSHRGFDYDRDIGVAAITSSNSCLEFPRVLRRDTHLSFVIITSASTGELTILRAAKACSFSGEQHRHWHHYYFRVLRGSLPKSTPALALARFEGPFTETPQGIAADLDRNGTREFFRSCTSSEGIHLTIWAGKPLVGQRKWHDYYYLGYDVDAGCTAAETQGTP